VAGPTVLSWDSAAGVFGLHSSSIARHPLATPNWGRANVWGCPQQLFRLRFGAQDLECDFVRDLGGLRMLKVTFLMAEFHPNGSMNGYGPQKK